MYLVIDVGGTFIKHCVMDRDAEIMEKNKVPTPGRFGNGLDNIHNEIFVLSILILLINLLAKGVFSYFSKQRREWKYYER